MYLTRGCEAKNEVWDYPVYGMSSFGGGSILTNALYRLAVMWYK